MAQAAKTRASASSTHKKVVVLLLDRTPIRGYLNPLSLGRAETIDLLTLDGEHRSLALDDVKSVYFVREFTDDFAPERKTFLSRPKLDGLWVRLRFRDDDVMEGIVANDLLDILDTGVQLTPARSPRQQSPHVHPPLRPRRNESPRRCRHRPPHPSGFARRSDGRPTETLHGIELRSPVASTACAMCAPRKALRGRALSGTIATHDQAICCTRLTFSLECREISDRNRSRSA